MLQLIDCQIFIKKPSVAIFRQYQGHQNTWHPSASHKKEGAF
jgi:hypothetical protein